MATRTKNTTTKSRRFDLTETFDNVKHTASDVNKFVLETSEDFVDETFVRVGQWQEVGEKAVKGGLKLAQTQQDIVFDLLETFKGQMINGRKRFKAIFN